MNTPGKDYTHHSWLAAAALIAVLMAVSFIPPQSVGGVKLRRANILSDLLSFDDAEAAEPAAEPALFDEEEFHIDMAAVAERIEADTTPREVQITYEWAPRAGHGPPRTRRARLGALRRDADPDRGFQRQRTHPGLLRHAAQRSAPGAHRLPGRLVRRGRHPHGRPARTAPVGLLGRRRGIRPDGLAADGVPAHGQNPVEGLDDLQHHARKAAPRAPAREFLRLGLGEPACGRGSTRWESTDYRKRLDSCTTARCLFPLAPRPVASR